MQSFSGESLFLLPCHISLIKLGTEVSEAELWSLSSLLPVHLGSSRYQPRDGIYHGDSLRSEFQIVVYLCCEGTRSCFTSTAI